MAAATLTLTGEERTFLEAPDRPRDMINDDKPIRRPRALSPDGADASD